MSEYAKVLKNRNFFLLWLGQIVSQLGDRLDQMALLGLIYLKAPGSPMQIAKIMSFTILPVFIIGPLAGVYVDRWDKRRTMYICDFLRAALVLSIPLFFFHTDNFMPLYIVIFITFSIGRFFVPAKMAILPELVEKKQLLMANTLANMTGMIAAVAGFGISGLLVEWVGAKSGFFLDSLSFTFSALLVFFISAGIPWKSREHAVSHPVREMEEIFKKTVLQELQESWKYVLSNKHIRFTVGLIFTLSSALGALYVVMIVFVQRTLHSATKDLGLLIVFLGAGLFCGSVCYGRFGSRISHYRVIFFSLAAAGVMLIVFAFALEKYPVFNVAAALAFLLGLSISPIMIASNTIIHRVSDSQMRGKVFSALEIIMHLGFLTFMLLSSKIAERLPEIFIIYVIGGLFVLIGLVNIFYKRMASWLR
ncbi:MAG: MFS transporter [Candidatus Omnitrophota bacterium]